MDRLTIPSASLYKLFALALLLSTLAACPGGDIAPTRSETDAWTLPDLWQPPSATDAGPQADIAPPPIEQSPPDGTPCTGLLTSEGTRWVKEGAGPQSIYDAPMIGGANPKDKGSVPEGGAMKFFPAASKPGWACVLYGGTYGYIDANNLATVPPSGMQGCKASLPDPSSRWVKAGTGSLNLRSEPAASGGAKTVLTAIPEGTEARYRPTGDEPGWACLTYGGHTGYASAKYLSTTPNAGSSGGSGSGSSATSGGVCKKNLVASWCGPLTKPCSWRTTKSTCEAVHWFTGIFKQDATPCCMWSS